MITPELAAQEKAICKLLLKTLRLFYADEQNRKEFEELSAVFEAIDEVTA